MKKILVSLAAILVAGFCYAGADQNFTLSTTTGTTTTVSTERIGAPGYYLDTIIIDVTGTTTGTVSVINTNETIISAITVTADTVMRPRMPICYSSATALVGQTNAFQKVYLINDALKLTWFENAPVTGSANVKVKFILTDN